MRTTIRLSEDLLDEIKLLAAHSGKTMTAMIEDALREMIARQQPESEQKPVRLTTLSGYGIQQGIDLDDSAVLLSIMEAADDT